MSKMLAIAATVAALLFCGMLMCPTPAEADDGRIETPQLNPVHLTYCIHQSAYVAKQPDDPLVYAVSWMPQTVPLHTYVCVCKDGSTRLCKCTDESSCICPGCACSTATARPKAHVTFSSQQKSQQTFPFK